MKGSFINKLHHREIYDPGVRTKSHRQLYGDRRLINDLDIVNELDGHSGCVNALSWSKSGGLLASGSDDQHLNIHKYQPENSTAQFQLATTVATGHTANIFSVKFMPHSNDRTVITAAGDSEVRVFDLEHSGAMREASTASAIASEGRRSRKSNIYNGVRYLSDGDTDCRVYRSHGDRVKRIVTESSPYLFLTCSEDGEVRQWDLRQPSSAYPAPRAGRLGSGTENSLPPPLISYKRYQLDLNTISCSASQPHYIALGGAHLHAFLHDRRMTGRDRLRESGKPSSAGRKTAVEDEDLMVQATRCVRKFAPTGRKKMNRSESGHITACKISDARPNEMIVSWSGDHIYSFDLVRSPDADDDDTLGPLRSSGGNKAKESRDRKRKRQANSSQTSLSQTARPSSRPRTEEFAGSGRDAALRIRYENGQSEDIPISMDVEGGDEQPIVRDKEFVAQTIAEATVKIRSNLFGPLEEEGPDSRPRFSPALGQAAVILSSIDEAMKWRYPMEPSPEMVYVQKTLRRNRESARRFVQAGGTLARVLGGKIPVNSPAWAWFTSVEAKSNDLQPTAKEQFGYDFLKAILLWLDSGIGNLIEGFTRPGEMLDTVWAAQRLPIPESKASTEAIDEYLVPYLLELAGERPIVNVEINKFEVDENRRLFDNERTAVMAFAAAVRIPFADLSSAVITAEGADNIQAQDRETATKYWASKVGRGVLLNAAEGVDFTLVSQAFGGSGRRDPDVASAEASMEVVGEDEDNAIEHVEVLDETGSAVDGATADDIAPIVRSLNEADRNRANDEEMEEADVDESTTLLSGARPRETTVEEEDDDNDDDEDMDNESSANEDNDSSDDDEEDGVPNAGIPRFMYASAYERRRMRDKVGTGVPCSASTRRYRGHCNVRTVKDVNYFGLDDDYVVSGSDDGHLFIWDRKTSELVNVLEGDGETVNVIQGHPYETMLAVSGIDHTIKIFSPDARAREVARMGEEVQAADASNFSSLAWPSRFGRRRQSRRETQATTSEPAVPASTASDPDDETLVSPTGLASRKRMHDAYRIMNQNDVERQGGNQDAFLTFFSRSPFMALLSRLGNVGIVPAFEQDFHADSGGEDPPPGQPFDDFS